MVYAKAYDNASAALVAANGLVGACRRRPPLPQGDSVEAPCVAIRGCVKPTWPASRLDMGIEFLRPRDPGPKMAERWEVAQHRAARSERLEAAVVVPAGDSVHCYRMRAVGTRLDSQRGRGRSRQ